MDVHIDLLDAGDPVLETVLHWHWREWSLGTEAERDAWRGRLAARIGATGIPFTLLARWGEEPVGSISVCSDDVDDEFADRGPWLSGVFVLGAAATSASAADSSTLPPTTHAKLARPSSGCTREKQRASTNAAATRSPVLRPHSLRTPCSGARSADRRPHHASSRRARANRAEQQVRPRSVSERRLKGGAAPVASCASRGCLLVRLVGRISL